MPSSGVTGPHQTQHSNRIGWGWRVGAGVGLLVAVAVVVVSLIAALRSGREIDPNQIMLALIALLGSLGALIVPKLNAVGKNTSQTAEHVVNSHSQKNLRDDIDEIKRLSHATAARLTSIEAVQSHQSRDILGLRQEIGQIRQSERDQWDAIESTASKTRNKGVEHDH
jgi:flagellar motor component MotA